MVSMSASGSPPEFTFHISSSATIELLVDLGDGRLELVHAHAQRPGELLIVGTR